MENNVSVQDAPVPQHISINTPSYTIPDATCMFDGNDSFIWNLSERMKCFKLQNIGTIQEPTKEGKNLMFKKTFPAVIGEEIPTSQLSPKGFSSDLQIISSKPTLSQFENLVTSKKEFYNPLQYTSSSIKPSLKINEVKDLSHNFINDEKLNSMWVPPKDVSLLFNKKKNEEHFETITSLKPNIDEENGNILTNNCPLKCSKFTHVLDSHDPYIEIIQRQNQQILDLQEVLNKFIDSFNNSKKDTDHTQLHCSCCRKLKSNMKNVGTMTNPEKSVSPSYVSVATNTDIPWYDITRLDQKRLRNINHNLNSTNICKGISSPLVNHQRVDHELEEKHVSSSLRNLIIKTIYEPPNVSPHLELRAVPPEQSNDLMLCQNVDAKSCNSVYPNESGVRIQHPDEMASSQENNGIMFYNNVMINIQQVLQKNNLEYERNEESDSPKIDRLRKGQAVPFEGSFNDRRFDEKSKFHLVGSEAHPKSPRPSRNNDHLVGSNVKRDASVDLERFGDFLDERNGRIGSLNYVADADLAALAQSSSYKGMRNRFPPQSNAASSRIPVLNGTENDYSTATKSFLNRYKLND